MVNDNNLWHGIDAADGAAPPLICSCTPGKVNAVKQFALVHSCPTKNQSTKTTQSGLRKPDNSGKTDDTNDEEGR